MKIPYRFNPFGKSGSLTPQVNAILGQIIEENGVKKFGVLSFNGTTGTVINSESFQNVYSFNKLINKPYKRRVAYLESTGTQFINTGVKPDYANGESIEIGCYKAEYSGAAPALFGSRQSPALNGIYALGHTSYLVADENGFISYGSQGDPGDLKIKIEDHTIYENDIIKVNFEKNVTSAFPVYIFSLNNSGYSIVPYSGMKLYYFKYFKNGVLAQYLLPVIDFSDVPCVYDVISNNLIYNSGTGTFNYGELQGEDVIELGQIIEVSGSQKFGSLSFDGTTPILKDIKTYSNTYTYNIEE